MLRCPDPRDLCLEGRPDRALPYARTEALVALETALDRRSSVLPQVPGDPHFAPLRGNPRYEAVLDGIGVPSDIRS